MAEELLSYTSPDMHDAGMISEPIDPPAKFAVFATNSVTLVTLSAERTR